MFSDDHGFEDRDIANWVRAPEKFSPSGYEPSVVALISEWLHGDKCSVFDNNHKRELLIQHGLDKESRIIYANHPVRKLLMSKADLYAKYTYFLLLGLYPVICLV